MLLRNALMLSLSAASLLLAPACASHSYYLIRTGTITLRLVDDHSPSMLVGDSGVSPLNACGHGAIVSFGPDTRIVYEDGTRADTSALTVGRKVSAFMGDDGVILESCPPKAYAAKVIVH